MFYQILGFFLIYLQIDRVTDNQLIRLAVLCCLLIMAFSNYNKTKKKFAYTKLGNVFYLFITMIVLGNVRSSSITGTAQNIIYEISSYLTYTFFLVTSFVLIITVKKAAPNKIVKTAILYPMGAYVALNLLLWQMDVKVAQNQVVQEGGKALMLSSLGINMDRVFFPLAGGGINTYSDFLGAFLVICLVILIYNRIKLINYAVAGITLVSMLMVDSRSFLINAIMAVVVVFFVSKTRFLKNLKYAPIYLIISPFFLLTYLPAIYKLLPSSLVRTTESSSDKADRLVIWGKSVIELAKFKWQNIAGYGEYGHYASGVSKQWSYLFSDWVNPDYASPHNTFFSIVFDYGYIGVVIYFLLIQNSIKKALLIWKLNQKFIAVVILSFWVYYLVSGATDTLNGFYSPGLIYLCEVVVIISELYYLSLIQAQNAEKVAVQI